MLRNIVCYLVIEDTGEPIDFFLVSLSIEVGTDRLSRNVGS